MTYYERQFFKIIFNTTYNYFMSKHTLANKSRYSILKLSGFRARISTPHGRKTLKNRRRKGQKNLALRR